MGGERTGVHFAGGESLVTDQLCAEDSWVAIGV
jgi:hypothetical protein